MQPANQEWDGTPAPCTQGVVRAGSPPPVDPNVGRSGEPGVEDVDAAHAVGPQQRVLERRVVVEPQALPEPVDRINDHHSTGRVLQVLFLDGEEVLCARSGENQRNERFPKVAREARVC